MESSDFGCKRMEPVKDVYKEPWASVSRFKLREPSQHAAFKLPQQPILGYGQIISRIRQLGPHQGS